MLAVLSLTGCRALYLLKDSNQKEAIALFKRAADRDPTDSELQEKVKRLVSILERN